MAFKYWDRVVQQLNPKAKSRNGETEMNYTDNESDWIRYARKRELKRWDGKTDTKKRPIRIEERKQVKIKTIPILLQTRQIAKESRTI